MEEKKKQNQKDPRIRRRQMIICLIILCFVLVGVIIYNFANSDQEIELPESVFTETEKNNESEFTESVVESSIETELESESTELPMTDTEIPPTEEQMLYPNHEDRGEEEQYTRADFVVTGIPKDILEHIGDAERYANGLWQAAVDQGIGSFNRASYLMHTADPYQTGLPLIYIIICIHSMEDRYITTIVNTAEDSYSFIADITNGSGEYIEYVPIDPERRITE